MTQPALSSQIPDSARLSGDINLLQRNEQNICGVTVMCKPGFSPEIRDVMADMAGVEVFDTSDENIFVVTVEDTPDTWAGNTLTALSNIKGVLNAALVYHQIETDA